ncbi:transposase, partial [Micromonospora sp. NPDC050417]|uniref:IS110 family transposase n=1 Tax=Micromonospora sp. NPDC050417 TaxID=3364280 RepID=UPI00379BB849
MLADIAEVVIGVDTHKDTHTAALIDSRTGAVLDRATVNADPAGYAALTVLADQHSGLRAWALEGSGGYGAGLARHLAAAGEMVVELDRPQRPARRGGAKSDLMFPGFGGVGLVDFRAFRSLRRDVPRSYPPEF